PLASDAPFQSPSRPVETKKKACTWYAARVLALLRQINADPPFEKQHSMKGDAWEAIATALCASGAFDDCNGIDGMGIVLCLKPCHRRLHCGSKLNVIRVPPTAQGGGTSTVPS